MEDKDNNLEKFFRDKFNQRLEPQDWNIPDNEVWDSIASEISKEDKKRRVGILPILFVGASILLGLWLGIDNYQKGKNIAQLQQELKECAAQPNLTIDTNTPSEKLGLNEANIVSKQTIVSSQPTKQEQYRSFGTDSKVGKYHQSTYKSESAKPVSTNTADLHNEYGNVEIMDRNDNLGIIENELNNFTIVASLTGLKYNSLYSQQIPSLIDFLMVTESIRPIKKTTNGFVFGPVIRYIHWQDKIKGSFDNPLSNLLVKEETFPSMAFGVAVGKNIGKRFVFSTGVQYYQRNQTSQYAINLPYSTINEINVGTEYENRFSHSLPTGLGNINTNLVLSRSINSSVENNENVYLDFSLQNHTKAMAIPLMLSYYLTKSGDGFFLQGGVFNEFIIQNEIREVDTQSHHTFVKDKSIVVDYNKSQVNKVNVSTMVGIGYEKELIKDIGISLSANYGFALNSTFATSNYQHKIDQLGLQMMVVKKIK